MRLIITSLAVVLALFTVTACNGKSSSDNTTTESSAAASPADTSGAAASTAPEESAAASAAPSSAAGTIPSYPGATTQASGSSSGAMGSAAGTVMSTDDSFDKVYQWYQQNMPAGSEKSHVTSPMQSAVFTVGEPGSEQTSVTITTQGGKTMISIAKVKM
jgi:hypothetical protein